MSTGASEPRMAVASMGNTLPGGGPSPRTGASSAPVNHDSVSYRPPRTALSPPMTQRHSLASGSSLKQGSLSTGQLSTHSVSSRPHMLVSPLHIGNFGVSRRGRSSSFAGHEIAGRYKLSPSGSPTGKKVMSVASASLAKARARNAQKENDAMVYLDGQQVYTCAQCRTHLTSHDDIISKSFHGRNGRAYLFDACVNVTIGKAEDRVLITGLHSVCDIFCKRCKTMVGWTYARAYEASQKYKEKKFIIEKINLHMEESPNYELIPPPAGERHDRWRRRSMRWGTEAHRANPRFSPDGRMSDAVFEYHPSKLPHEVSNCGEKK